MSDVRSIGARRSYWITPLGIAALERRERCKCDIKIDGLLWVCRECDTVYAKFETMRGFA